MKYRLYILFFLMPIIVCSQTVVEVVEKHPFLYGAYAEDIAFDNSGLMWIATQINGIGILQYNGSEWFSIAPVPHNHEDGEGCHTVDGLATDHNVCITIDHKERIWIGSTGHGVSRLIGTSWSNFTTACGLGHGVIRDILVIEDTAWIATANGLSKVIHDSVWVTYRSADGLPDASIICLCVDTSGNLWIGTEKGLACFKDNHFYKYYPIQGNLTDNYIDALVMDKDNNIWAAIYNSGLWKFNGTKWNLVYDEHTNFSSLTIDNRGRLWAGSRRSGVYQYNGTSWKHYTMADNLYDERISSIAIDRKGAVWIGTFGGLTKIYDTIMKTTPTIDYSLNNISTYPNPAVSNITIEDVLYADIQIYNSSGQLLFSQYANDETMNIDIDSFSAGLYIIRITRNKKSSICKFTIAK
jgi:ligand-binding sensor domain-containing protein